jgi:3-hydroxybutyrate dehydrogenase
MRSLKAGASILVTGSTSGIGLGMAECLARWSPSAHVFLNGFGTADEIAKAKETVRAAQKDGSRGGGSLGDIHFVEADLSTVAGAENVVKRVVDTVGRLDVLVNNAGVQHVSPIHEFPVDKYEKLMAINLHAVFHTMRVAIPTMRRNNFGRIINVASVHGLAASPNKSAYVASKHGVIGMTKSVALEVARTNITCNAICPGWVLTPLVDKQIRARMDAKKTTYEDETTSLVGEKMPACRPASVEEMGNACVYLASPSTASTNGAALNIDGGWIAGTVGASETVLPMSNRDY